MRKIIKEKRKNGTIRVRTVEYGKSLTDPSFEKEVEINNIVRQYTQTGQLPNKNSGNLIYSEDIAMPRTMMEAHEFLVQSKQSFAELPPEVRLKFDNKVEKFADALQQGKVFDIIGLTQSAAGTPPAAEPSKPGVKKGAKPQKPTAPSSESPDDTVQSEDV